MGDKAFSGRARGTEPDPHPPAAAEPRVSQRLLFPLTALVSAKSASDVGSSTNSGRQRGDLLTDKAQCHATLSTAARGAPAARFRAPLSAAYTSLPHVWFRLVPGGFTTFLTFQLLIFLLGALSTRSQERCPTPFITFPCALVSPALAMASLSARCIALGMLVGK